jgi:hypothetical protein
MCWLRRPVTARGATRCRQIVSVAAFVLGVCVAARADVPITVVDYAGPGLASFDVGFDASDEIVVAYRPAGADAVNLARIACGAFPRETIASGGHFISLAMDSLGFPCIVHSGQYTYDARPLFDIDTVPIPAGNCHVVALDSLDRPCVASIDGSPPGPAIFNRFDIQTGDWTSEPIPGPGGTPSVPDAMIAITVDDSNQPVVAYYDEPEQALVVATRTTAGWSVRADAEPPGTGVSPAGLSVAVDSVDAPHVAYVDTAGTLRVSRFHLFGVTNETAATDVERFSQHGMVVDEGDTIHAAYQTVGTDVAIATRSITGWTQHTVAESVGPSNAGPRIALDSGGHWVIAFNDTNMSVVKVASTTIEVAATGDFNCDGDVDLSDYGVLLGCYNGPGRPPAGPYCWDADSDGDNDVDLSDYGAFLACYNGPDQPPAPGC